MSKNAYTIAGEEPPPVSFVTCHRFDTLEECLGNFDFTVCQAGVTYDRVAECWVGLVAPEFYRDLAAKRLVLASVNKPVGTFNRVLRYVGRGYYLDHVAKVELLSELCAMSLEDIMSAADDEY